MVREVHAPSLKIWHHKIWLEKSRPLAPEGLEAQQGYSRRIIPRLMHPEQGFDWSDSSLFSHTQPPLRPGKSCGATANRPIWRDLAQRSGNSQRKLDAVELSLPYKLWEPILFHVPGALSYSPKQRSRGEFLSPWVETKVADRHFYLPYNRVALVKSNVRDAHNWIKILSRF